MITNQTSYGIVQILSFGYQRSDKILLVIDSDYTLSLFRSKAQAGLTLRCRVHPQTPLNYSIFSA